MMWLPLATRATILAANSGTNGSTGAALASADSTLFELAGRLQPGISPEQATAAARVVAIQAAAQMTPPRARGSGRRETAAVGVRRQRRIAPHGERRDGCRAGRAEWRHTRPDSRGVRDPDDARAPRRLHQRRRLGRQRIRRAPSGDRRPTLPRRIPRASDSTTLNGKRHPRHDGRGARPRRLLAGDRCHFENSNRRLLQTGSRDGRLCDVYRPRHGNSVRARSGAARDARRSGNGTQGLGDGRDATIASAARVRDRAGDVHAAAPLAGRVGHRRCDDGNQGAASQWSAGTCAAAPNRPERRYRPRSRRAAVERVVRRIAEEPGVITALPRPVWLGSATLDVRADDRRPGASATDPRTVEHGVGHAGVFRFDRRPTPPRR